tara:strand:+ start:155 stop:556 length:402 start_codon:yes stop_codon:yes gene_type:complete
MGRVSVRLNLSSSDVLSSPISLDLSSALSADSGFVKRVKIASTSVGTNGEVIYKAGDKTGSAYLYVRNLQGADSDIVTVYEATNNDTILKVKGGEFAFLPIDTTSTFHATVSTADDLVEFGVFGSDSSSVRYT